MDHTIPLQDSTDAMRWAEEFVKVVTDPNRDVGADPTDAGFMVTWFAGAIEVGKRNGPCDKVHVDLGRSQHEH